MNIRERAHNLTLAKAEPWYFRLFLVINLAPLLSWRFFPTADGPSHLYNARVILELLHSRTSPLHDFYIFNSLLNPNSSGHFLLSFFLLLFPAFIAEKLILLIYVAGLPLGMRYLLKSTSAGNIYLGYLIFPFTWSYLFYFGFYNFNIGLVLFLPGAALWIRHRGNLTFRNILVLTLVSSLICLSHLFIFVEFLLFILLLNILALLHTWKNPRAERVVFFKNCLLQLAALAFGLILLLKFVATSLPSGSAPGYLPARDILISLKYIMPVKGINIGEMDTITRALLYIFSAATLWFGAAGLYRVLVKKQPLPGTILWLVAALVTLAGLFILPDDQAGNLGLITSRLMIFFFIFLILWLSSQPKLPRWPGMILFILINLVNFAVILHNFRSVAPGCKLAGEIHDLSAYIKPNQTVLPVLNSNNMVYGHISSYLGYDKPMVLLDNYEAAQGYFPLVWNYKKNLGLFVPGLPDNSGCAGSARLESQQKLTAYVLIISDNLQPFPVACKERINKILGTAYERIFTSKDGGLTLYEKKAVPMQLFTR